MIQPELKPDADEWPQPITGRVAAPLREQVVSSLRKAILDSQLKPGQRLVERNLIESLGVSRTTVREALRELASESLVTVVPQKGAIVTITGSDDAKDLYEVRAALEPLVIRRFIARASESQFLRLRAAFDDFARASTSPDIRYVLAVKDNFYSVLVDGAGSYVLQQLIESIQARVQVLRMTSLSHAGRPQRAVQELKVVVEAIEARDPDKAARACVRHVRAAAESTLNGI